MALPLPRGVRGVCARGGAPARGAPLITLGFPPTLNHLYSTVRGHRVLSRAGRQYKTTTALRARMAGMRRLAGPVAVTVRVFRPRRSGDLDNTLKVLLDSLKGVAWNDDSQVVRILASRYDDKENPRVELEVEPWTAAP